MGWCTTFDLDEFAAAAGGYLRSRAAENTLLLSAALAARSAHPGRSAAPAQATASEPGGGWLFGWWEPSDGGEPRGVFLHDPAAPLLLSGLLPEMAASLAATLAKMSRPVLGVDAPTDAADAFAAAWSQRAGTGVRAHRRCYVYRLPGAGAWPPPQLPAPPGRLRVATAGDHPLLAGWLTAFANETAERIGSPHDLATELISYGGAFFWETPQLPVALATLARPAAGSVRISMLYTLPERRHGGYASALTLAVSRAVLSSTAAGGGGAQEIVMITDRNRPNLWATRLGYQLVSERAVLRFGPVTGGMPRVHRTGPMPRLPTGPLPRAPRLRG